MVTETAVRTMSYAEAIREALPVTMGTDPTVVLLGEDIAGGAGVDHLVNDDVWGGPLVVDIEAAIRAGAAGSGS